MTDIGPSTRATTTPSAESIGPRPERPGILVPPGLKGVIVTDTEIGDVRGREGFYHYRQYSALELARAVSMEAVWHLLFEGRLPDEAELQAFRAEIAADARLRPAELEAIRPIALAGQPWSPLDATRTAVSLLGSLDGLRPGLDLSPAERRRDAMRLCARIPLVVAALWRMHHGLEPLRPDPRAGIAENYLRMVTGKRPRAQHVRAIEQYLISTMDHGFNASTFTARVIAATGADLAACVVGAIGAFSGPLHGGSPSRALETLDAIGDVDCIDEWVRPRILSGERMMGFGHAVYRTEDPRARMLRDVAVTQGGARVDFALEVERRVLALLDELKPGRELHTNVEFWAGVVMELCEIPRPMFTPTFLTSRVIGWCANVLEQTADNRIIRPSARYVGPPAPQPVPDAHAA